MFRRLVLVKWQTHYIITWSHLIFLSIVCFELIKDNDLSLVQISWGFGVLRFPIFDERKASETEVSAGLSQEFLIVNSFKGRFGEKQTSTRPFFLFFLLLLFCCCLLLGFFVCVCVCFVVVVVFWGVDGGQDYHLISPVALCWKSGMLPTETVSVYWTVDRVSVIRIVLVNCQSCLCLWKSMCYQSRGRVISHVSADENQRVISPVVR